MKEIPLKHGMIAKISDGKYNQAIQHTWRAVWIKDRWYVRRGSDNMFLHRFVMGVTDPKILVDHRDGDGLNNQDDNLRVATQSQNMANQGKHKNNTIGYKGVVWDKRDKKFRAQISVQGKRLKIGYFEDPIDAARAYDEAARKYYGRFARTNF